MSAAADVTELEEFRSAVRAFAERELAPKVAEWDEERRLPREIWRSLGNQGLLGLAVDEQHGGGGIDDFRFRQVISQELARVGATAVLASINLQDDVVIPYVIDLGTDEQKDRLLPGACRGEFIGAIGLTEPGAGSDLQGLSTRGDRTSDGWVLNGSKTFISSGIEADYVIVLARTDPEIGRGFTLFLVERGATGFERGRKLDKIGMNAVDTAELFFHDVHLPDSAVVGTVGQGLGHVMERLARERLSIAVFATAAARAALDWTVTYVTERRAFGERISDFQNTRFVLAEIATEIDVADAYVTASIDRLNRGELSSTDAAKAKWWTTDLQKRSVDRCLQLFGGYGYIREYPIARAYEDARVQTIYGGTNEIMKSLIAREILGR